MNNKKDKNDLSGFEELLEDFVSTENSKHIKREISDLKNFDNFELERYLEIENERLSNLESFFTKKIPNKLNFSQSERLSKIQTKRIDEVKEKINQKIDNFDSTLSRNLSKLFDHIF